MLRLLISAIFLLFTSVHASSWETEDDEEALFLRRIADFWQEGEYQIVKTQIEDFLLIYPNSSFAQTLYATLGDLYLREKNYKSALLSYSKISDQDPLKQRVFLNRMQCLLELQWFATLAEECELLLNEGALDRENRTSVTYLLSVALYQQCLNAPPNSEELAFLIERAHPYFKFLMESEFCSEIGPAFAHICCLEKNYAAASDIYLKLSQMHDNNEEMYFQAALLQAKADRPKAIEMFREIETRNHLRSPDAVYNRMVLMAETESYEQLVLEKDDLLTQLSPERKEAARFLIGHAYLKLKLYGEAIEELSLYTKKRNEISESHRIALADLIEASYELEDESLLHKTVDRLCELFPHDQQVPKGILAYALLLKKSQRYPEAKENLQQLLTTNFLEERERATFELSHIEFLEQNWEECRTLSLSFLKQFRNPQYSPLIWRFLATSSFHLSLDPELKEQFIADIEELLAQKDLLVEEELNEWRYHLAKTYIHCKHFEESKKLIDKHLLENPASPYYADAHLLLALCYRDGRGDHAEFYKQASKALQLGSELYEKGALHIALFNASLELKNYDLAADHLYLASQTKNLETEHLLWLADFFYEKVQHHKTEENIHKCIDVFEKFLAKCNVQIHDLSESMLPFETVLIRLAELCTFSEQTDKARNLLESIKRQRDSHPEWAWEHEDKVDLLLGENYARMNRKEEALHLFESIQKRCRSIRNHVTASATLQSARLQISLWKKQKRGSPVKILTELKNLVLQKTLSNEPIHLEAAFEYIDLQVALENNSLEKRLALSKKIKEDFEEGQDLLTRDYQQSRKTFPRQDRIYTNYINMLEAEILICRALLAVEKEEASLLKAEARKILKQILKDAETPFLVKRVKQRFGLKKIPRT